MNKENLLFLVDHRLLLGSEIYEKLEGSAVYDEVLFSFKKDIPFFYVKRAEIHSVLNSSLDYQLFLLDSNQSEISSIDLSEEDYLKIHNSMDSFIEYLYFSWFWEKESDWKIQRFIFDYKDKDKGLCLALIDKEKFEQLSEKPNWLLDEVKDESVLLSLLSSPFWIKDLICK